MRAPHHRAATVLLALGLAAATAPPLYARRALPALPAPPADGLRLVLVRHGEAYSNLRRRSQPRNLDPDNLTGRGYWQATEAGRVLGRLGIKLVLVSPARRARQTADKITSVLGHSLVRVDDRLRPLDPGRRGDGRELSWREREADWRKGRDPSPPGGESLDQVGRRIAGVAESLAPEGRAQVVLLVSHNEVISSLLGLIQGRPPLKRFPPGVHNASISVVDVGKDGRMRIVLRDHVPWR